MISIAVIIGAFFFLVQPLAGSIRQGLDLQGGTHVVLEAVDTEQAQVNDDAMNRVVAIMEKRVNSLGLTEPIIQREDAQASTNPQTGQNVVNLEFSDEGAQKFAELTTRNVGRTIAILLDGEVLTAPNVREPILGGRAEITGQKTLEEAQNLAVVLRSGALPVKVEIIETRTVGPTLGQDSKDKSQFSFVVGLGAVVLFMIFFYHLSGLIADVALMAYTVMLLGVLYLMDATLTLPGVAGIILSIGMAVDANVLIFEHFKEEYQVNNKSLRLAMDAGFRRAFTTIFDSNVTTLIAAGVLFFLGTGTIRGFAITLGVGTILSMFTAITLTQYLLKLMINSKLSEDPWLYGANGFMLGIKKKGDEKNA